MQYSEYVMHNMYSMCDMSSKHGMYLVRGASYQIYRRYTIHSHVTLVFHPNGHLCKLAKKVSWKHNGVTATVGG